MAAGRSEAERMARHNAELKLALAENLSLPEARERLARQRWQAADRARAERLGRCGTATAPCSPSERQPYWWERDDL